MARKRGPGRPKLSAAEKAERKALREKEGRKASGRRPGRPAGSGVKRGRKAPTEYQLLVAELAERVLQLEKSKQAFDATASRVPELEKGLHDLTIAHQILTDVAAKTEAKLSSLCEQLNHYFGQLNHVAPEVQEAPAAANQ